MAFVINRLLELLKSEKQSHLNKHVDDEWFVDFKRIKIRYDIQGCGGQGIVYNGILDCNTSVALKRVNDVSLTTSQHLKELNHKNVIKFIGVTANSNHHYIIMEWGRFGTLHDLIHCGKQVSSTILTNFALQIAYGMKYLHSKNIIHRDLKPSNILLTQNDVLKISDFETHKVHNDKLPVASTTYAGTHAYMAPEVIRGEPYSFPVDVWSYGVVFWEILIGEKPYKNLDSIEVVLAVGNDSIRLPSPSGFPRVFSRILNGCWKSQPSQRFTFQQIFMILKVAIHDIDKILKVRWAPLQAEWKREVRDELERRVELGDFVDIAESHDNQLYRHDHQSLEDLIDRIQKRKDKNTALHWKLSEISYLLEREQDELKRAQDDLKRAQDDLKRAKEDIDERETAVALREKIVSDKINRLKEEHSNKCDT